MDHYISISKLSLNDCEDGTCPIDSVVGRKPKALVRRERKSERIKSVIVASSAVGDIPRRAWVVEFRWISGAVQRDRCVTLVYVDVSRHNLQN